MGKMKEYRKGVALLSSSILVFGMVFSQPLTIQAAVEWTAADYAGVRVAATATDNGTQLNSRNRVNAGENSAIIFDTGYGPKVDYGTPVWLKKDATIYQGSEMNGVAGNYTRDYKAWNTDELENIKNASRPKLPWRDVNNNTYNAPAWDGYNFKGWKYVPENRLTTRLTPIFEFYNYTVYQAIWQGDDSRNYSLTTHYFRPDGTEFTSVPFVQSGIIASTERGSSAIDIPGYKVDGSRTQVKNGKIKDADGDEIENTGLILKNGGTTVQGEMPNQDATVNFYYDVDPSQSFSVNVQYLDADLDAPITIEGNDHNIESPAEGTISVAALNQAQGLHDGDGHPLYIFDHVQIVQNGSGTGVYKTFPEGDIRTSADFSGLRSDYSITGIMPNQNITVLYYYKHNPDFRAKVTANFQLLDQNDNVISGGQIYSSDETTPIGSQDATDPAATTDGSGNKTGTYTIPQIANGYQLVDVIPAAGSEASFINLGLSDHDTKVQYQVSAAGGTFILRYKENYQDTTAFTKVQLYVNNASYGSISNYATGYIRNKEYSLLDLFRSLTKDSFITDVKSLVSVADPDFYEFKTWHQGSANGTVLSETDSISCAGSPVRLYAEIGKIDSKWADLHFVKGNGEGSLNGRTSYTGSHQVKIGDALSIYFPTPQSTGSYSIYGETGAGWYLNGQCVAEYDHSASGPVLRMVQTDAIALNDATYTFNFASSVPDDGQYYIPNATGKVDNTSGSGTIHVDGSSLQRSYAVTDLQGKVIVVKTGVQLDSDDFTGLVPGCSYKVYELPKDSSLTVGDDIPTTEISAPEQVNIPAVSENVTVPDGNSIQIEPAASGTEYALSDADGNVICDFQQPVNGQVIFDGLEPDTVYTITARPIGSNASIEEQLANGSNINTGATSASADALTHTVKIIGEGRVTSHRRAGEVLAINDDSLVYAKQGDQISISAESTKGTAAWDHWNIILGNISGQINPTRRSFTFTMPSNDVVLETLYSEQTTSTPDVTVSYKPDNDDFGIDSENLDLIKNEHELATSSTIPLSYKVVFDKTSRPSQEGRDAIKNEDADGGTGIEYAWAVKIKLIEKHGSGRERDVTDEYAGQVGPFTSYATIPDSVKGNQSYKLWRLEKNPDDSSYVAEAFMEPDLSNEGSLMFEGSIGDTIVLTYRKACHVSILNNLDHSLLGSLTIGRGESLSNSTEFNSLNIAQTVDGDRYEFKGLSKSSEQYKRFDEDTSVNGDLTLYAYYIESSEWKNAHENLRDRIEEAQNIINGGSLNPDLQSELEEAVNDALAVYNQNFPTSALIQEQIDAAERLKAVVDDILGRSVPNPTDPDVPVHPTDPTNPIKPDRPSNGGSGGSGSGGGGSATGGNRMGAVGSTASNSYQDPTYKVGTDGKWVLVDAQNHKWAFELNNGTRLTDTWANLLYTYGNETRRDAYHFASDGIMDSGWILRGENWYYLSSVHDGFFGHLISGWHHDSQDGNWYYLDPVSNKMLIGWNNINSYWYYFNEIVPAPTWRFNSTTGKWEYMYQNGKPLGSMYENEATPDGHFVDSQGVWIQGTP